MIEHAIRNPFPRTFNNAGSNTKTTIIDEMCDCGKKRSDHNDSEIAFGHGNCPESNCNQFTWIQNITK